MATMMRLQRFGKKRSPFYHIVIADGRAPRDGKYIEKIGTYNPIPNPADIKLNFDKALDWLQKGAQPTETMRAILSYKGALLKKHLVEGMKKGALTEEQVESKFAAWLSEKDTLVSGNTEAIAKAKSDAKEAALAKDKEVSVKRAEAIAAKNAPVVEEAPAEEATEGTEEAAE